ncbi:MAG TPA: RodZ domain-containing protein [Steroidobacteraceae bacterium]|jgi:cytoskeleton protein RodZ
MNVNTGAESGGLPPEPLTPGEWLKRERERRGLSLEQAAEELRLDPWIVEALEANRFAALGAPVYARGHLKKYALELGLPPERVLELYESVQDTPVEPTPIPATLTATGGERRSLKAPAWGLAILLAAALVWLVYSLQPESEVSGPATPVSVPPASTPAVEPTPEAQPPGLEESEATASSASREPAAPAQQTAATVSQPSRAQRSQTAASTAEAAPSAEPIEVRLEFSAPSWTEIYDASGQQLVFATGLPGRTRTVSGVPPLRVTLGLASAVTMQVDGSEVLIPRRAGRDSTTFVIEADGSVRPQTSRSAMTNSEVE